MSKLHNKDLTAWYKYEENPFSAAENVRKLALEGFSILGTNAECAVPQIAKVLAYSDEAARALLVVGPKGFSALTNAMNDSNMSVRDALIRALGKEGGGDTNTIRQILVNALNDPDKLIRLHTAELLQGKEPDLVIPTLVPLLSDNAYRWRAANLLAVYGSAAKSAAPNIFSIFTNQPDMMLLPALRKIDPDIAAQAETFLVNSGPLNGARFGYTRTRLPNGKELIAGGWLKVESTVKNHFLSSAELLDPKTGKWTETGEMHDARWDHTAILLNNGQVLVVGGSTSKESDSTSAELYDPTTGKWKQTGSMNHTHCGREAVLQSNGTVWMPGGWDGRKMTDDEVYDPATEKWTVVPKK